MAVRGIRGATTTDEDSESAIVVAGALQTVDGVISVLAKRLDGLRLFVKIAAREWQ